MTGNLMTPSKANNMAAASRTFASMSLDMFQIVSYTAMLNFELGSTFNIAIASWWKLGTQSVTFRGSFIGVKPVYDLNQTKTESKQN